MDDDIRRVETQIEAVSKTIDGLFALKNLKRAGKATFDSDREKELQYWINEKEALRKKEEALRKKEEALRKEKEDLREKELLLLKKYINESESKALILTIFYKVIIIVILTQSKISL